MDPVVASVELMHNRRDPGRTVQRLMNIDNKVGSIVNNSQVSLGMFAGSFFDCWVYAWSTNGIDWPSSPRYCLRPIEFTKTTIVV